MRGYTFLDFYQVFKKLMMSDGHIHDKEYELCRRFAEKIGKTEVTLNMIIDTIKEESKTV